MDGMQQILAGCARENAAQKAARAAGIAEMRNFSRRGLRSGR
jgi:hypothetical protein